MAMYELFTTDDDLSPFHRDMSPNGFTYLVSWADAGRTIVKVGESCRASRWRHYLARGAQLHLAVLAPWRISLGLEGRLHRLMPAMGIPMAFASKHESVPFLGTAGGWMECYEADADEIAGLMRGELDALVQG